MSNVFKLFILVLLFIKLLLIDGCIYYDGQRIRLKDLKKDGLNGKYGVISNQNNKNQERCGVLIDGTTNPVAIKWENLDKIPTIFIHGERYNLVSKKQLYHFIQHHSQDKIGLPHGNNMIQAFINYGIITSHVFAFGDDQVQQTTQWYEDDTEAKSLWEQSVTRSIVFSDEILFDELQESVGINLQEWRDFKIKHFCLSLFHVMIGDSAKNMGQNMEEMCEQFFSKVEEIHRRMGCQTETQSLEKYFEISELTQNEIIDTWLEIVKKYLVNEMKNDEFIDINETYGNIVQETLNEYVNIIKKYNDSKEGFQKQMRNLVILHSIMTSKKIVKEYLENYDQGSNVYVFGNGPPKLLHKIIEERLSMIEKEQEMHVAIIY